MNDTLFNPDIINNEWENLKHEIKSNKNNKSYALKLMYYQKPNCYLRRNYIEVNYKWNFNNFYNDYFCFCIGDDCFEIVINQTCKYLFYITVIEKNKNLYPKTDYIFVDFIFNSLTSDDVYPLFQEMEKQNYPVHYLTENKNIIKKYNFLRINNIY